MTKITLQHGGGQSDLQISCSDVISLGEEEARRSARSKQTCFTEILNDVVKQSGFRIAKDGLNKGVAQLNEVRSGKKLEVVFLSVSESTVLKGANRKSTMIQRKPDPSNVNSIFERIVTYKDGERSELYDRLVGIDSQKNQLLTELELLLFPERLTEWSVKNHGQELSLCRIVSQRPPLVLLEGDVGCGKTALAETVGSVLAQKEGRDVHLMKLNTQVRGTGLVGEMTDLIVKAFAEAEAYSSNCGGAPVILLVDEADAIATARSESNMHHEDKAGVNTILQRIDGLRLRSNRIVVMFISNRPEALDPAIRRRASVTLKFDRPNDCARQSLLKLCLENVSLTSSQFNKLVVATGQKGKGNNGVSFTASDITDRLLVGAIRQAFIAQRPLAFDDILAFCNQMNPSPIFGQ